MTEEMSVSKKVRVWRSRARNLAVGLALCLSMVFLLKMLDPTGFAKHWLGPLLLFLVFTFLFGLYCTRRYWKEFRDDEIRRGGSVRTALEKWRSLHPPLS